MDRVGHALEHVPVARQDQRAAARLLLEQAQRPHHVVRLVLGGVDDVPAQRPVQVGGLLPLVGQVVGHLGPVGVVGRVGLRPVLRGLGAEAHDHRAGLEALDAPQGLVDRTEQRVDRPVVGARDRVGQPEERPVEQVGSVGDEEGSRSYEAASMSSHARDQRDGRAQGRRGRGPGHQRVAHDRPGRGQRVRRRDGRSPVDPHRHGARQGHAVRRHHRPRLLHARPGARGRRGDRLLLRLQLRPQLRAGQGALPGPGARRLQGAGLRRRSPRSTTSPAASRSSRCSPSRRKGSRSRSASPRRSRASTRRHRHARRRRFEAWRPVG